MTVDAALALLHRGDADAALAQLEHEAPITTKEAEWLTARGMALLAQKRPQEARECLRRATRQGRTPPATLLNLALAEDGTGRTDRAHRLMRALAARIPGWDQPPLRLAESLRAAGRMVEAEQEYRRVLEINSRSQEALIALGGLLILRGRASEACGLLLRCCTIAPNRGEAWDTLGRALLASGDPGSARDAFSEAQRIEPRALDHAIHGVEAALAAGDAEAELGKLEAHAASDPANPAWHLARGVLLDRLDRRSEAADALETAMVLAPEESLPAALLGNLLASSSRLHDADRVLKRARELAPDDPRLINDHAAVMMRMCRHAEARALLLDLIERHGRRVMILSNLANATACVGLQDESVALAREAIARDPNSRIAHRALCNNLPYHPDVRGRDLLDAFQACSARLSRAPLPPFPNSPEPDRKLVLGLLSGNFKVHPVAWLTVAGFETLAPDHFDLVCLAQNAGASDSMANRYRAIAREWIEIETLDDLAVAKRARSEGIDILIDLGGYGDAGRLPACAHRLAPVQVKWVGMQNHSTGLPEMDWIITDRWETPPVLECLYSERMLRLPDGYACYSPPAYAPDVAPLPASMSAGVTFGCFNNLAKVTPVVIETWARVLTRVPGSRLVLKTHQFRDEDTAHRIRAAFANHGIAAERLDLRGPSGHRAFMAEYNQIDIVLDPFPYSGGLTTCEALWMGVPTVTLPGETFASRHSLSHLNNAGLMDWAATDVDSYVDLAAGKAADLGGLAKLRQGLRARVKASPLCDAPRFGHSLGVALRYAWREWCGGR